MAVLSDIPEIADVIVDVSVGGFIKRDDQGRFDYIAPLPAPFNYGSVPGTVAEDGDRIDVVILGRRIRKGTFLRLPVRGVVDFLDAGHADPKWICSEQPLTQADRLLVIGFFRAYAVAKGFLNFIRGKSGATQYRGTFLRIG